jgi:Ser/Thr protein kinase RdoA (MazF antagonist)
MQFDKPIVLPADIATIMAAYPFGQVLACQELGGLPNTTYKVVTEQKTTAVRIYGRGQSSLEHIDLELKVLQHLARLDFESPRLLAGSNGQFLQQWKDFRVCVTEFIPGVPADTIALTPELVCDVGRLVASFQKAMALFKTDVIPDGGTVITRGLGGLASLDAVLSRRGWEMDFGDVIPQWQRASEPLVGNDVELDSNVIHADIWPPNVICEGATVVGLVDFDDCLYGATFIDVAIALLEFSMFQDFVVDEELAVAFFSGYFRHGGMLSALEEELIVNAIEMLYVIWLAYYVAQSPYFEEAEKYLHQLNLLSDDAFRRRLCADVQRCIHQARRRS